MRRADRRRTRSPDERAVYERARQARRGGQARAIAASYDALGEHARAAELRQCGRLPVYVCAGDGGCGAAHARAAFHCRDRLCPYCATLRGWRLAERVAPLVAAMRRPLFLTLTVRNGPELRERGMHLRRCFGKLRRRVAWRAAVAGGIYVEEITRNERAGTWHPHAHLIVDSALPPRALEALVRALWAAITGDSFVVDARPLDPADLREACKYTAKLGAIVGVPALVGEFLDYARGRRLVIPFGSCYGADAALAGAEGEGGELVAADVLARPCPSCGQVGTLAHDPGRRWDRAAVAAIGGGWYARCATVAEWRAVLAARAGPGPPAA